MKINYRIKTNTNIGKWSEIQHENTRKYHCDMCNSKLWIAPDNKTIYCDKEHNFKYKELYN